MNVEALHKFFDEYAPLPQKLGTIDCVTFTIEALRVGWDKDYRWGMEYNDRRSAVNQLRTQGSLLGAFRRVFGFEDFVDGMPAGSIAYFPTPATVGLVLPDYIAVKAHKQIIRAEKVVGLKGWRVN